ncbi:hypothetical protein HZC34_00275 [Candidatus Saganbacteria bacterium]|nr:hypothetical protein [Candidatus Saganbacteria bacterium]
MSKTAFYVFLRVTDSWNVYGTTLYMRSKELLNFPVRVREGDTKRKMATGELPTWRRSLYGLTERTAIKNEGGYLFSQNYRHDQNSNFFRLIRIADIDVLQNGNGDQRKKVLQEIGKRGENAADQTTVEFSKLLKQAGIIVPDQIGVDDSLFSILLEAGRLEPAMKATLAKLLKSLTREDLDELFVRRYIEFRLNDLVGGLSKANLNKLIGGISDEDCKRLIKGLGRDSFFANARIIHEKHPNLFAERILPYLLNKEEPYRP